MMEEYEKYLHERLINRKYKNAVLCLSGGTDSALVFYLICEYVVENNIQGFQITPIHGWDMRRVNAYSPTSAKKVYSYIKNKFPTVKINDLYLFAYNKLDGEDKPKYHRPVYRLFEKEKMLDRDMMFSGSTLAPQDKSFKYKDPGSINRKIGVKTRKGILFQDTQIISSYDKRWVRLMYEEKGLKEIFQYTVSCIGDEPNGPCKSCWWCHEKYWAFGRYDGESL
tara:strand:- start:810 stop:1481 length:672 start_codon:yes stop_codon:yes gene_type:complete